MAGKFVYLRGTTKKEVNMAHRKTCFVLLFLAFLLACASCSNPQDEDRKSSFQLDKPYREIMQGSTLRVFITSGSGDLQISNSNAFKDYARIAYARTPEQAEHVGVLSIQALQVGEFQVSLTDNLTKERQQLTVKVLPPYLLLEIHEGSDPVWSIGSGVSGLFLVQNAAHSFYLCRYKPTLYRYVSPAVLSGVYEIVMKDGVPTNLRLQSKKQGIVRDFTLTGKNKKEALEKLGRLGRLGLLPNEEKFICPVFLDEHDMEEHIMAEMTYKEATLPEKVME
jgi:hypothetical protein